MLFFFLEHVHFLKSLKLVSHKLISAVACIQAALAAYPLRVPAICTEFHKASITSLNRGHWLTSLCLHLTVDSLHVPNQHGAFP